MNPCELLAARLTISLGMLKRTLADFSDADMLVRPALEANHAAWQLGHLATTEANLVAASSGGSPPLPEGFAEKFSKEMSASDDIDAFPTKDAILDVFIKVRERTIDWLRSLEPDQLDNPTPQRFQSFVPTLGHLAIMLSEHTAMHMGQMQVVRRKLGKPVIF